MKRFAQLFRELDATTKTNTKLAALERYFTDAPPADAAWAVFYLSGGRMKRLVKTSLLREWAAEQAGLPLWLLEECYHHVGDLAETLALILPAPGPASQDQPLHHWIEDRLQPLVDAPEAEKKDVILEAWSSLDHTGRFLWNKLLTGAFRVGVGRTQVARALAAIAGVEKAEMQYRLMGGFQPTAEAYERLLSGEGYAEDNSKPYPFFLASPLDGEPEDLGLPEAWRAEWKWDGIRAQLIKRGAEVLIWSRGEELVTEQFPEIAERAAALPDGTVLDGEILAWGDEGVRTFGALQKRLGRKRVGKKTIADNPVTFLAYDCLETEGEDFRAWDLDLRAARAATLAEAVGFPVSEAVDFSDWPALATIRDSSRARRVEGLMLKRRSSPYRTGRVKGDWYKWKIDPMSIDAVLVYAQAGHGRRSNLYTDYTFAVWNGEGVLVPVAKAYSGLTDKEFREVDRFVRKNTIEKFGPVRSVKPELVFELHFEGIRESTRHKSGVALRFPRMHRWRRDKPAAEAETLDAVKLLL